MELEFDLKVRSAELAESERIHCEEWVAIAISRFEPAGLSRPRTMLEKYNKLWPKHKTSLTSPSPGSLVPVAGDNVEVVESFTYLGVDIHNSGSSEHDIR